MPFAGTNDAEFQHSRVPFCNTSVGMEWIFRLEGRFPALRPPETREFLALGGYAGDYAGSNSHRFLALPKAPDYHQL